MKVLICKFFNDKDLEHKIGRLASREKKRTGNNLRVFCVDEQVQKRLESVGIGSEILEDFLRWHEESSWEKLFQLSDQLCASAEHSDRLKYSGINFLTLEFFPFLYVSVIKFSSLCERIAEEGCDVLLLVLTESLRIRLPDIRSRRIRTVKYGNCIEILRRTRLIHDVLPRVRPRLRGVEGKGNSSISTAAKPGKARPGSKALFVVGPPLYARPAAAIIHECLRNDLKPDVATDDRASAQIFQRHGIDYSAIPILKASYPIKVLRFFYRLRKHVRNCLNAESDDFSEAYLCTKALMAELLPLCYLAISSVDLVDRMIKATSPDLIVLMPDGSFFQHIAAALARKHRIPTLACSSALENDHPRAFVRHLHADKKAVMGEVIRKLYIDSGVDADRIVVTGAANFDVLFNRDKEKDKQALISCNIDPGKKVIIFTTQSISFTETERMLIGVIKAVTKMNDVQLIVKVHPREDMINYKALAEEFHEIGLHVVKDIDLYALINNCELLITKYSTTALEAIILDKPVVTINLSGEPTPVPYAEDGAAIGVCRIEDLEQAITEALYDEETRSNLKVNRLRFARYWAGEPDGEAAQRIVTLMKEMIAASAKHSKGAA